MSNTVTWSAPLFAFFSFLLVQPSSEAEITNFLKRILMSHVKRNFLHSLWWQEIWLFCLRKDLEQQTTSLVSLTFQAGATRDFFPCWHHALQNWIHTCRRQNLDTRHSYAVSAWSPQVIRMQCSRGVPSPGRCEGLFTQAFIPNWANKSPFTAIHSNMWQLVYCFFVTGVNGPQLWEGGASSRQGSKRDGPWHDDKHNNTTRPLRSSRAA